MFPFGWELMVQKASVVGLMSYQSVCHRLVVAWVYINSKSSWWMHKVAGARDCEMGHLLSVICADTTRSKVPRCHLVIQIY